VCVRVCVRERVSDIYKRVFGVSVYKRVFGVSEDD
jgi:hypothetical protein